MSFEQFKNELSEIFTEVSFEQLINKIVEFATTSGFKILAVIILVIVGLKAIKWLKKWIRTTEKLDKVDSSLRSFAVSFVSVVLYALLFVTVLMILGVPATSFVAVLTTCAAAIGLALQGSLSNFAGGIMILLFKPFKVGDYIEAAGESGVVSEISVVYTELLTVDNKRITIPNGTLTNSVIENYSSEELRRVDLTFRTSYDCDMGTVKNIIGKVIDSNPMALKNPEPFVRLSAHGESANEYTIRIWCKNADYWDVYFDTVENVEKAFNENGIKVPLNQIDVHINNK
ncbi:MAG: mechanosensitive ion channel [Clostridia bacterium]|nr:mechanosensitive ion channel [Clostridia bacterium]